MKPKAKKPSIKKNKAKPRETSQTSSSAENLNLDPVSETPESDLPFIYGVGSSAGGLEALRELFSHIHPTGTNAFIVVQHMSPTSKSMLTELLAREAKLPVKEAKDGTIPIADTVYVVPPNADVVFIDGHIRLDDLEKRAGPKPSIDKFFKSLALECGSRCGGVILSGTGSDGSVGLEFIAESGGLTIIQDPDTAKYDGMPRMAIGKIAADFVLGPQAIADRINQQSHDPSNQASMLSIYRDDPYKAIIEILRRHSNIDFSLYKPKTILRRIQRGMDAVRIKNIDAFVRYLEDNPETVPNLLKDVLITVTEFFRDKELFKRFQNDLIQYLRVNPEQRTLRIWCAACSTGEEAYSLAIAGFEAFKVLKRARSQVQVFATDVSEDSMAIARKGAYPKDALEEVEPSLRKDYFHWIDNEYRIEKRIRDSVLFARHDLTCDPPFMKMDVISCRNVFIYLDQKIQDRIIQVFHYALKPGGILFLGKSENLGSSKPFFASSDVNTRVFSKIDRPSSPDIRFSHLRVAGAENINKKLPLSPINKESLLKDFIKDCFPNSLVVDEAFSVRSIHGFAREFLNFPDGEFEQGLQKLLVSDIKSRILTLLHRAKRNSIPIRDEKVSVSKNSESLDYIIDVHPIKNGGQFFWILSFHKVQPSSIGAPLAPSAHSEYYKELEVELASTREHLQTVIEEQETANEELQALNEELQSTNEELQSTNEELETSNEELQSTNEELVTVNEELNVKTAELAEMTHHLTVIQNAISNAILVFDRNLNLVRYNTASRNVLRVDANAFGKNIRLVDSPILNSEIIDFIEKSFRESRRDTRHFVSRDLEFDVFVEPIKDPLSQANDVVVSFVDNTQISKAFRAAQAAESRLVSILAEIPAKISVRDSLGRYTYANPEFCRITKLPYEKVIGSTYIELLVE